jgi:hypothetical protein
MDNKDRYPPMPSNFKMKSKGIWIWKGRYQKTDRSFVLLCSEGLFNPEAGPEDFDLVLTMLFILLSDVFIFNTVRDFEPGMLQMISQASQVVGCLSDSVKMKEANFRPQFPLLVWAVRDVLTHPQIDGRYCSPDEFFEHCLKIESGLLKRIIETNNQREIISSCFTDRRCISFPPPSTDPEMLANINAMNEHSFSPEFRESIRLLSKVISDKMESKNCKTSDGKGFISNIKTCLEAVTSNNISVCSKSTQMREQPIEKEIEKMKQKLFSLRVKLPMSLKTFNELTKKIEEESLRETSGQVLAGGGKQKLEAAFVDLTDELLEANEKASTLKCIGALKASFAQVEAGIRKGNYSKKGSVSLLENDLEQVKINYFAKASKEEFGPQISDVLLDFETSTVHIV